MLTWLKAQVGFQFWVAHFTFFIYSMRIAALKPVVRRIAQPQQSRLSTAGANTVSDLRKEYSAMGLDEKLLSSKDPYTLFSSWFDEARSANVLEPNAMCLSTCKDNKPSARYVLLKAFDEKGFVWYTNYNSRKSGDIIANPHAALTFWWGDLERSVRIEGKVEKVSDDESDSYFNSRPRSSQIGAWSSSQSSHIENREALEAQEIAFKEKFNDELIPVPRPPHWGGFRLRPSRIEFWKGRESRLHDRLVFELDQAMTIDTTEKYLSDPQCWTLSRLQP